MKKYVCKATLGFALMVLLSIGVAQSQDTEPVDPAPVLDTLPVESELGLSDEQLAEIGLTPLPLEQIKSFANIFMRIKQNYVKEVSDEELLEFAVEGMLNGLDPHSIYLKEERFEELTEDTTGRFGGLGMEVVMEDGFVRVVAPIDDTPAAEAGIQSGDIVIRIDGQTLSGNSLTEATEKMRGEPGTSVTLTILRESEPDPFDVELKRAVVNVNTVRRQRLSKEIGYLRVSQFQLGTAESFRKQLKMLREGKNFSGLIIDLRNNPGGLLNSAVSIADAFITEGVLVSTRGRREENNQEFTATATDMLDGKPIVVLINAGSASASEIVAGALQDHKRALIVGTESFGKGSVQTVMEIDKTQAIKLTTARYYTPNGRSIQAAGIVPDLLVEAREFKDQGKRFQRIKEKDLDGHLENENLPDEEKTTAEVAELLERDYQLNEAFNVLKGMILFNKRATTKSKAAES